MELTTGKAHYKGEFPVYNRPLLTGFFSVDEKGKYFLSTKNISYFDWRRFSSRQVNLDLTIGENESIRRTDENEFPFYRYLVDHPIIVHNFSSDKIDKCGFICNRGDLRKISNIPYQDKDDELFSAYLYQGNIYLKHIKPEEQSNPRWDRCSRWGYKFEQYLLSEKPGYEPVTNVPVKEAEEFGCVFISGLNEHRLLFVAEMDGILIDFGEKRPSAVPDVDKFHENIVIEELRKRKFVELKTSSFSETNARFRKMKSRDIWLQSFFSGVETVIIGIRDYNGIVNRIKRIKTWDMLGIGEAFWDPNICMNFCDRFLSFVKDCFRAKLSHTLAKNPDCNIRDLPPIELFFERNIFSNVTLTENATDASRPYLNQWFLDGVSRGK